MAASPVHMREGVLCNTAQGVCEGRRGEFWSGQRAVLKKAQRLKEGAQLLGDLRTGPFPVHIQFSDGAARPLLASASFETLDL